jgi:hypothetical protein
MGNRSLFGGAEADGEGTAESDGGEGDINGGDIVADRPVASGVVDQLVQHALRLGASMRPISVVEQGVDDVDRAEAGIDGGVHVAPQCFAACGRLGDRDAALFDGVVEYVEYGRTKQCLAIGEMPVQGADTDTGPLGDGVSRRFAPDLEDQFDCGVEKPPPVPSRVGPPWWLLPCRSVI